MDSKLTSNIFRSRQSTSSSNRESDISREDNVNKSMHIRKPGTRQREQIVNYNNIVLSSPHMALLYARAKVNAFCAFRFDFLFLNDLLMKFSSAKTTKRMRYTVNVCSKASKPTSFFTFSLHYGLRMARS